MKSVCTDRGVLSTATFATCLDCGEELPPAHPRQRNPRKWCNESCRVRAKRKGTAPSPTACEVCGAPSLLGIWCATCRRYESPASRQRIFERDDWTCAICDEPIDPAVIWPNPQAATIDHRLPLSRGGGHMDANVQTAHFRCNVQKSNNLDYQKAA